MNIVIACDSFKGSLTSLEVAKNIKKGALSIFPNATFHIIAMADGGEGTVASMIESLGGNLETAIVKDPLFRDIEASYGILQDGSAIIEMAAASGLPLVAGNMDILTSSSYGTGQLIKEALDKNCKKIYIGIGGSATNDGGIGMVEALGVKFYDQAHHQLPPIAASLNSIAYIDMADLDQRIKQTEIIVMCDVDNPLCGQKGASAVYGPQKGATSDMIPILDQGLENLADIVGDSNLKDVRYVKGAGAAGGLGFGLMAFLNAQLLPGIEVILDISQFDVVVENASLVITGEGRIDHQSIYGKVPVGVSSRAKQKNKPTIAIVGCMGEKAELVYDYGIDTIESCVYKPCNIQEALNDAENNLIAATKRVMRAIKLGMDLNS